MGLARTRKRVFSPAKSVKELGMEDLFKLLSKDLREHCSRMSREEARFVVDLYYQVQQKRIALDHQALSCERSGEPPRFLASFAAAFEHFEKVIKSALNVFASEYAVGRWCLAQIGVGPVITAGLLSEVDIRIAKNVGKLWRFAGLDPTVQWKRGEKRPWNAFLKTLCAFKLGESFVHTCNHPESYYGRIYKEAKQSMAYRNEAGEFREVAQREMERAKQEGRLKKFSEDGTYLRCWQEGKLPPAHIHARARRKAVKVFLAHLHEVMHRDYYGTEPPVPYIFAREPEKHSVKFEVRGWPCDGRPLRELYETSRCENPSVVQELIDEIEEQFEDNGDY